MSWLRAAGSLSISAPDVLFLDVDTRDAPNLLRGVVTLSLRRKVALRQLSVVLHGRAIITFSDGP